MHVGDNAEPILTPKRQELLAKAGVVGMVTVGCKLAYLPPDIHLLSVV